MKNYDCGMTGAFNFNVINMKKFFISMRPFAPESCTSQKVVCVCMCVCVRTYPHRLGNNNILPLDLRYGW